MGMNGLDEHWVPEHVKDYLRRLGFVLPLDDMKPWIRSWDDWMSARGDFYDYQDKDGVGRVYGPACGSGNFLTETYLSLRQLEDVVLMELRGGQASFGFGENAVGQRMGLSQFYGIKINDFTVTVAKAALWISRLKINGETSMLLDADNDFLLTESTRIVQPTPCAPNRRKCSLPRAAATSSAILSS